MKFIWTCGPVYSANKTAILLLLCSCQSSLLNLIRLTKTNFVGLTKNVHLNNYLNEIVDPPKNSIKHSSISNMN